MTDTSFGSGLTFSVPGATGPTSVGGAPLQPNTGNAGGSPGAAQPSQPAQAPPQSAPPPQANFVQQFGAGLGKLMGGPNYQPAPPGSTPEQQSQFLLQQQAKRANSIATDPLAEFFNPEGAAAARAAVPQLTQQLQAAKQQQQQQQDIMSQVSFGLQYWV
jgi:hypothetical protein